MEVHENLFPAMFCSKACLSVADRFHHFELIGTHAEGENGIVEVAQRVVFEAIGIFGKVGKLQKFCEEHREPKTVFDFDLSKADDSQKEKNLFEVINSLQRNSIPEDVEIVMDKHVALLQSITNNPRHKSFLGDFLRKQTEIVITNSFGIASEEGGVIGSAIFALSSFFNHSCAPNITRIAVEDKLAFVVSRPIEKNQQLFVCYRSNFFRTGKLERQEEIKKSYRFKCLCQACVKEYPTIDELPSTDKEFVKLPASFPSTEEAKLGFIANCDYINKHIKSFPSFEICTLMERNRLILEAIASVSSVLR